MKSIIKSGMILIGLLLIGIAVVPVLLHTPLEAYARSRIEQRLGHIFGSDAHVRELRLVPAKRGIELLGVTIDNPPSFEPGPAVICERMFVSPNFRTLFSRVLVVDEVTLNGTSADLHYRAREGTNLGLLSKQAADLAAAQQTLAAQDASERMLKIKKLTCSGVRMTIRGVATAGIPLTLRVEPFTLHNLGDGKSVSFAKASSIFLRSLLMETITLKGLLRPVVELLREEVK